MMNANPSVSVIIPLSAEESSWRYLLQNLVDVAFKGEVVLVAQKDPSPEDHNYLKAITDLNPIWVLSPPGRANQMNLGADIATGQFVWFLHADTTLMENGIEFLFELIRKRNRALYYFNLKFSNDGPWTMWLNEYGVWIRSHMLKLPFGDQGFLLERSLFRELGGYNVSAPYGEDHLLVWKAHQCGVPVLCTGASLKTSARKYRLKGWSKTTLKHLYLTYKQALPEFVKLINQRRSAS